MLNDKRYYFLCLLALCQIGIVSRVFADTIPIPEVFIQSSRELYYSSANNNYEVDSFQMHFYGQHSIAEVLQQLTPAQINFYGVGGIATISLRGTADDQTAVYWNGIKLNSLTLGTMDVSLLPVNTANQMSVITNASGAVLGSGNFGGAILLNYQPSFQKETSVSLRQDFSSFRNFKTSCSVQTGNRKVQFSSSSFYQQAKNNFPFYDKYKFNEPLVLNAHNEIEQWATVNELSVKLNHHQQLDIGNFTLQKHHNIPAMMGAFQQSEKYQDDLSVKNFVKFQRIFSKGHFYIRSGHVYDYMLYNDNSNKIYAPYYSHQWQNSANYRHHFKYNISLDAGVDYNLECAKVSDYAAKVFRHRSALFAGGKYILGGMELSATVRQELLKGKYIRPQFGILLSYSDRKRIFQTSISYADKFRLPDFNDLYWQPGGNKNLLPENGYTLEYSLTLHPVKPIHKYQLTFSNTIYYSVINNNIVWSPIASGLYSPQNIKKTRHWGLELKAEQTIRWNLTNAFTCSVNYNLNRSTIVRDGSNQGLNGHFIRYKPEHTFKSYLIFADKYFKIGGSYLFVSSRFTDDENIKAFELRAYSIIDMFVSYNGYFKKMNAEFIFKVNNLSNTKYESLRSYAQPLRNYMISLVLHYKFNHSCQNN